MQPGAENFVTRTLWSYGTFPRLAYYLKEGGSSTQWAERVRKRNEPAQDGSPDVAAMLSHEEITARIERAFLPLRCVAEIWDNGQSLRFQVFDANDNSVLRIRALRLDELRDEKQLEQALQLA